MLLSICCSEYISLIDDDEPLYDDDDDLQVQEAIAKSIEVASECDR